MQLDTFQHPFEAKTFELMGWLNGHNKIEYAVMWKYVQ